MKIVDTHQHLWNQSQFSYSWTHAIPALDRSFSLADYRKAAEGAGITQTIFVECDADAPHGLAEARAVEQLASENDLIAGIVAAGRPGEAGFREHLEALSTLPRIRGLRRVLHTQPDAHSRDEAFRRDLRLLPEFDLTFDLCALARQLPVALELVQACPEVSFVLDHAGIPDIRSGELDTWRKDLAALAREPNVVACKLSGLVAYVDPERWTTDDLRPCYTHVIDCFGWNRVIWGGDWPVCTVSATLREWVDATHQLTAGASPQERAQLYHLNAERIYRV